MTKVYDAIENYNYEAEKARDFQEGFALSDHQHALTDTQQAVLRKLTKTYNGTIQHIDKKVKTLEQLDRDC